MSYDNDNDRNHVFEQENNRLIKALVIILLFILIACGFAAGDSTLVAEYVDAL